MSLRSDYLPAKTFCCVCGMIIKEHQIGGDIDGIMAHRDLSGPTRVDPFHGYLCREHAIVIKKHLDGGLPAAERRVKELERLDRDAMGK